MWRLTILTSIIHIVTAENDPKDLQFLTVVHRHGDRSPLLGEMYPTDPYINYSWHGGLGALSPKGARQLYNLGCTLRPKYAHLLPPDGLYSKQNMHVASSSEERCLNSVQNLLAGFMPPMPDSNSLPLPWQSVPVSFKPANEDNMLLPKKPCPKYDAIYHGLLYNPAPDTAIYAYNKQHAKLYEYLSANTGKNVTNCYQGELLNDNIIIERDNNFTLPNWTDPVFPEPLLSVSARSQALFTETPYMKRIKGGPLLTQIVEEMVLKRNGILTQNIAIYSGHDVTLSNLMRALEIQAQTFTTPEYGAALIFELFCIEEMSDCIVNLLYYKNTETTVPIQISIPNCPDPCSLDSFIGVYNESVLITDFDAECRLDQSSG